MHLESNLNHPEVMITEETWGLKQRVKTQWDNLKLHLEKEKKSTLRSLKIVTEKYCFRYREMPCCFGPAQEDACWQKPLRLWEVTLDFVHEEFHGCICTDRNAHSYHKLWSHPFIQWVWVETFTVQGERDRQNISLFIMSFMLKPNTWLELNLLWIFSVFFPGKTSWSVRDLADQENNTQLSPSKSSISLENHSWLKRRDIEAGGKVQCSKAYEEVNRKGWNVRDEWMTQGFGSCSANHSQSRTPRMSWGS